MSDDTTPGVWPCVQYTDADAARTFLTDVFGFTETITVRGGDGDDSGDGAAARAIVHAELRWPEGGGLMYGSRGGDPHADLPAPSGVQWLYVVTADPDAVHRRAVAAGATVVMAPYDADYGSRNVAIADPEGNVWTFGTYAGS